MKLCLDKISEELPTVTHTVISLTMVVTLTSIVILLRATGMASGDAFSVVLNLTGGISGSFTSFILPTMIYLKMFPNDGSWKYLEAQIIYYSGYVIMLLVVVSTIVDQL